jgi:hypothetical protein
MFRMLNAYLQLQLLVAFFLLSSFFLVLAFLVILALAWMAARWGPWVLLEVLVMMLIFVS